MASSRRLALAKFLKKAKSTKGDGDSVALDVPPTTPSALVTSLLTPPSSPQTCQTPTSPPPIAAVPLAAASTHAPARPDKGKRVLEITSDSEDSGGALVFKKRRPARVPTRPTASPGGRDSLRDEPPSATSPSPQAVQEEQDEGAESIPPPLPSSEVAAASGSIPPAPALAPSPREILNPHPVYRQLAQGFFEGMSPENPNRGGSMPYYLGAFLAVTLDWRSQAQSVAKGKKALRKLKQEVGALKQEKQTWGLREEGHQASLKLAQEGKEGAEAYAYEVEQAYADLLAHLTSHQIQNIDLQEVARASEMQQKKLEELNAVWRQKLAESEGALGPKVEAFDLLQAEDNKLRVGKEFLDKQLASKDSRITELEREVQELTGDMAGVLDEGFQEALVQASCENPGINVSNCDPTHHVVDGKVVPLELGD